MAHFVLKQNNFELGFEILYVPLSQAAPSYLIFYSKFKTFTLLSLWEFLISYYKVNMANDQKEM